MGGVARLEARVVVHDAPAAPAPLEWKVRCAYWEGFSIDLIDADVRCERFETAQFFTRRRRSSIQTK
jgi:hypothetical protein